jgi:hypothetical protein
MSLPFYENEDRRIESTQLKKRQRINSDQTQQLTQQPLTLTEATPIQYLSPNIPQYYWDLFESTIHLTYKKIFWDEIENNSGKLNKIFDYSNDPNKSYDDILKKSNKFLDKIRIKYLAQYNYQPKDAGEELVKALILEHYLHMNTLIENNLDKLHKRFVDDSNKAYTTLQEHDDSIRKEHDDIEKFFQEHKIPEPNLNTTEIRPEIFENQKEYERWNTIEQETKKPWDDKSFELFPNGLFGGKKRTRKNSHKKSNTNKNNTKVKGKKSRKSRKNSKK